MPSIEDRGVIISINKFSEEDAIITIFSEYHGLISGYLKSYQSKTNLAKCMIGNNVKFSWGARLEQQLGSIRLELIRSFSSLCINNYFKIMAIRSACQILHHVLPERLVETELYKEFLFLLESMIGETEWLKEYVFFEMQILSSLGFGMDLTCCASTNEVDNLEYISPKSAKAISSKAGEEYANLLFKLPAFMKYKHLNINIKDAIEALNITEYFIYKFLLKPKNIKTSSVRNKFISVLEKQAQDSS